MNPTFWGIAASLAVVCMGGAALPMARRWSQQGLHLFVAVAVGIFLGTLFLHLMPELAGGHPHGKVPLQAEHDEHAEHDDHAGHDHGTHGTHEGHDQGAHEAHAVHEESSRTPWVAALAGLLTLFLIEKIWLQGRSHVHAHPHNSNQGHSSGHGHSHGPEHSHGHDHGPQQDHGHAGEPAAILATGAEPQAQSGEEGACDHDPHSHETGHTVERHALVWYASFLGLSIHATLDGLNTAAVVVGTAIPWPFLLSMLVHKASEGFSLATVIRLAGVRTKSAMTFLVLFSLMSPLGMMIGGLLATAWGESHLGILRGFACGSFLYVAIYDLLPEVFHDAHQRLLRCSAVALGILIVAASVIWVHG